MGWPEDSTGDKYDRERYEVWSGLNDSYDDCVHLRRLISIELVECDW